MGPRLRQQWKGGTRLCWEVLEAAVAVVVTEV